MILLVSSKYDRASYLYQQLQLASELDSSLQDTVYCCRKWFINFSAKKTVSFKSSNNIGMKSSRHFSILL